MNSNLCLGQTIDERQAYYRGLFSCHIEGKLLDDLWAALNKGITLGGGYFRY